MPTVPIYDTAQVGPAGLPNAQIQGLSPRQLMQGEIAGHEQEQAGQNITSMVANEMTADAKAQMMANQVRVDAALNDVRAAQQKLTYDPETGYLNQKGAAAVQPNEQGQGLQDQYGSKLQDVIDAAAGSLANDAQRQVFAQSAAKLATQFDGQIQSHVLQEYKSFGLQTQQGTIDLAGDMAQKNWMNPDVIDSQIASAKSAVWKAGQINGEPANLTEAKTLQTTSNIHAGVINEALQNNNPAYAQAYIQKYKNDMTAGDLLKAQGSITADVQARLATSAAQAAMTKFAPAFQPTASDRMLQITRTAESGGKDMDAGGKPVTSSVGAKYSMQVMPDTAANPGHGIAPAANDSPAEYNRVGTQLLGVLVRKYAGDPAKAWAAYNWGESKVDAAIKKDGANWLNDAPEETQNYVASNVKALQSGRGVQPVPTLQDIHQNIRDQLGPNADPTVVAKAIQAGTQLYSDAQKAQNDQADQVVQQAQQYLAQNKGDFNSMPPDLHAAIVARAPDQLPKLMTYANAIANPPKIDNMAAYHTAIEHPDELAAMSDSTFQQFAMTNFSDTTQKQISKLRQDTIDGKTDNSSGALNSKVLTAELNNRLTSLGIDTKPKDENGKQQIGTIQKFITDGVFQQQRQLGRKMTAQEISQYVDQQFLKNYQFRSTFMGISGSVQQMPYLSMKPSDIPGSQVDQIKLALAKQGNLNPSSDQIMRTYWTAKVK